MEFWFLTVQVYECSQVSNIILTGPAVTDLHLVERWLCQWFYQRQTLKFGKLDEVFSATQPSK